MNRYKMLHFCLDYTWEECQRCVYQ